MTLYPIIIYMAKLTTPYDHSNWIVGYNKVTIYGFTDDSSDDEDSGVNEDTIVGGDSKEFTGNDIVFTSNIASPPSTVNTSSLADTVFVVDNTKTIFDNY